MDNPIVIIIIDGFDPEYIQACATPNIDEICARGFLKIGRSMMPSVTNVNNVSLVTGLYPESHGINCNYWLNSDTGQETYMESADFILAETIFQKATFLGKRSLMVSSKDKLRTLIGAHATVGFSSEKPLPEIVSVIGDPPPIYSLEVNGWITRAADYLMSNDHFDIVYIATTDYAMHIYPPGHPESHRHMTILDDTIGDLLSHHPDVTLLLTADHGMSSKDHMIDLKGILASRGITSNPVPIIKDRYVLQHSNLGGCTFVYLDNRDQDEALAILRDTPGVHSAFSHDEAVHEYHLHPGRMGNIFVNGDPTQIEMRPGLRSHASIHEREIPLIAYNSDLSAGAVEENRHLGQYAISRLDSPS